MLRPTGPALTSPSSAITANYCYIAVLLPGHRDPMPDPVVPPTGGPPELTEH